MAGQFRCGDVVRERKTGNNYLVAYADYSTGEIGVNEFPLPTQVVMVAGKPKRVPMQRKIADFVEVKPAADITHKQWVEYWLRDVKVEEHGVAELAADPRAQKVQRLYGALVGKAVPAPKPVELAAPTLHEEHIVDEARAPRA